MEVDANSVCCSLGDVSELLSVYDNRSYFDGPYGDYNNPEEILEVIKNLMKQRKPFKGRPYDTYLAATPEKEQYGAAMIALSMAGFEPILRSKSFHGNYYNILWVYNRVGM